MRQGKKIPAATWKRFLELLAESTTSITATCRALDISPHSYYNYRGRNKEFGERVERIIDSIRRPFAEDALFALIAEKNLGAIKFYLAQMGGRRWNDARVLPVVIQHEMRNPPVKQTEQRLPTAAEAAAADAYREALFAVQEGDGNVPDTLHIDLRGIKKAMRENPRQFYPDPPGKRVRR